MNDVLETIKSRFDQHLYRHEGIKWDDVLPKINNPKTLASIKYLEETGGEVDVAFITPLNLLILCDFSKETPKGRRGLCYDEKARLSRKKNAPISSAMEEANKNGILLMDLDIYKFLALFYMSTDVYPLRRSHNAISRKLP
ncbi:MAG: DUF4256 domain-containing protein [Bacilli bacterium]|nr:DUF4256 domain-containing protein [Bacilli bacterium]